MSPIRTLSRNKLHLHGCRRRFGHANKKTIRFWISELFFWKSLNGHIVNRKRVSLEEKASV